MQHRKNTMIRKNEKDLIQEIYILEQKNKNTSNNSRDIHFRAK